MPVFGLLIAGIGVAWLDAGSAMRRGALAALVVLTVLQAAVFQWRFWQMGPDRGYAFDAAFPRVFEAALSTGASPIYLSDRSDFLPGYIEAYWYGALRGLDRSDFVRLRPGELPPAGSVVLGTDKECGSREVLFEDGDYIAYRAEIARLPASSPTVTSSRPERRRSARSAHPALVGRARLTRPWIPGAT